MAGGLGLEGLHHPHHLIMAGRAGPPPGPPGQQQQPADLSRRPCVRPFLISNIMGREEDQRREEEEEEEERREENEEEEGGVSPGTSPGPDSGSEMGAGDEDSIAKVSCGPGFDPCSPLCCFKKKRPFHLC